MKVNLTIPESAWARWLVVFVLLSCSPVHADVVVLTSGRSVEGRVIEENDEEVVLETQFGRVTFARSDVRRIERSEIELPERKTRAERKRERARAKFGERLAQLDPGDALGLAELSAWCRQNDLDEEADETEAMALAIAPDDEKVRKTLGHFRRMDGWITAEEHWRSKGLVKHEGQWMTPVERARRLGETISKEAHKKRRELALRARFELPRRLDAMRTEGGMDDVLDRLARYREEGEDFLQGMLPQHEELVEAVGQLAAGDFSECRETCILVMKECDGVMRWEEAAAITIELEAVRRMLASGKVEPTAREHVAMSRINRMRRDMGLPPLGFDERLYRAAASHCIDMIQNDFVAHESKQAGRETADQRGHAHGVHGQIGENIQYGTLDPAAAVRGWGNSLGHAQNMFEPLWRRGGLCAIGRHWTHNFGE